MFAGLTMLAYFKTIIKGDMMAHRLCYNTPYFEAKNQENIFSVTFNDVNRLEE
jgi:hypothetical protein